MTPTALIPMFTPEEAVAELNYTVGTLGLKAVVMTGVVPRRPRRRRRRMARHLGP